VRGILGCPAVAAKAARTAAADQTCENRGYLPVREPIEAIPVKLTAKLVFLLIVGAILVVGTEALVSIWQDVGTFKHDMRRDAEQMADTLRDLVEHAWATAGQERTLRLIDNANREDGQMTIRVVWLDAPPGDARRPRVDAAQRNDAGTGRWGMFQERDASGHGYQYTYVPLNVDSDKPAALELAKSLDGLDRFRRHTVLRAFTVAGILLVISAVSVAVLGITCVGRPLDRLIAKTRRAATGDQSGPVKLSQRDELAELAEALNQMCDEIAAARRELKAEADARVAAVEQLRHADRLTTVGRLAAGVAHELGTPMNVVTARADMIAEEEPSAGAVDSARVIKAQINKMATILRQLLDFARQKRPRKKATDLSRLAARTAELLAVLGRKQNIEIRLSTDGQRLTSDVDAGQIQQVLTNVLMNAFQAMPRGGTVKMNVSRESASPRHVADAAPRDWVRIDVQDNGTGISPDHLEQVFDPFFTTKDIGDGTGLGLSIAFGIITEHGGWIEVQSQPGQGARFSVYLPGSGSE
jgi:signal transduction histidine kinase